MIKQILNIIWNQRRSNGWIFTELLVVVAVLWVMMDSLLVDTYTYYSPMGFDIENVYKVNLGKMSPTTPGYVPDSLHATTDGEDLVRLAENIRQVPEVEEVALGAYVCPYTWNNSYSNLVPADADTTLKSVNYHCYDMTVSYFDVFRMKTSSGEPLSKAVGNNSGKIVITADMEDKFFEGRPGTGQKVKWSATSTNTMDIAAVSTPVRRTEYEKSQPSFFLLERTDQDIAETANNTRAQNMDCIIRMKDGFRAEDMERFLQDMSDRLTVNNIYVSSVTSLKDLRSEMLKSRQDNMKKKLALVAFMLVNVFFGIIGTFWLRTQYRRGEMGLRTALGSSRSQLKRFLDVEGLCLLAFTIPFVLLFIANMLYFDLPDTVRLPFTWWRFTIAFGGAYLLMAVMIWIGIWFPAKRIAKMNPADALHYE